MLYQSLPISDHPDYDLRPIRSTDLEDWFAYLSQPLVYEHTSWDVQSPADLASFVNASAHGLTPVFRLAVVDRSTDKLVGTIGFHSVSLGDRRAELAYDLSPEVWGKGLATYLAALMVRWAHEKASIVRVQATVLQSNARSIAVLRKSGFAHEGMLRCYRMVRGKPGDFEIYSHLAAN
jgi:ribosomal-protein-alanine N-acetyltransferase